MSGNFIGFIFFVLNIWDSIATKIVIGNNFSLEENPVMRALMIAFPQGWILMKVYFGLILWVVVYFKWNEADTIYKCAGYLVLGIYCAISISHVVGIFLC